MIAKVPLGEVVDIAMGAAPPGESYNLTKQGIPMIAGAGDYGEKYPNPKKWTTAPTRTTEIGDLIICVRATIGELNWADKKYCLGRGVAGIRAKTDKLNIRYAAHYINLKKDDLSKLGTGSTFIAIRRADIEEFMIPLPSLAEQKRIADILDKADTIRQKRQQVKKLSDDFLRSVFLGKFGDPVNNNYNWALKTFGDIGTLVRGKSKHRPRNDPSLLGGPYPLIQTGDIANANHYIKSYSGTYSELGLKQSRLWPKGTLCITIAANIANTAILTFDACFPDSVVGFTPNGLVTTEYIHMWLSFYQKILNEQAPESAQKNINLKILSELQIPVPPLDIQNNFSDIFKKIEKLKKKLLSSSKLLDDTFSSLMQRAFRGEL